MSMILNTKYIGKGSYKLFITNRILRLFPMYITILLMTLIGSISTGLVLNNWGKLAPYIDNYSSYNIETLIFMIFTNLFILGQDIVMFLGIDNNLGSLYFTENFRNTNPPLYSFLFIPQAWSIGIELTFYIIAPFLVRKNILLIILFIFVTICLRLYIYFILGLINDPWSYRFFPTELTLFLFGSIAYKIYTMINDHSNLIKLQYIILSIFAIFLFSYEFISLNKDLLKWSLYIYTFISIPYLFKLTKNNKLDNFFGELSYPIYLIHVLIVYLVNQLNLPNFTAEISVLLSTIISIILVKYIDEPIEIIRQLRVKNQRKN